MWLSEQAVKAPREERDGNIAVVTLSGAKIAVQSGSELRGVSWTGPGGVFWMPSASETVVTMACGGGETVILGVLPEERPALEPGELCLRSGGAEIFLRRDGRIDLRGAVNVEGSLSVDGKPVMVMG